MGKQQSQYVVKLNKTLSYPACVIDQDDPRQDIMEKLMVDLPEQVRNITDGSELQIHLEPVLFFKSKLNLPREPIRLDRYDVSAIAQEVAQHIVAHKYGKDSLSREDAKEFYERYEIPGNFDHPGYDPDHSEKILQPIRHYTLKDEIEEECDALTNIIYPILRQYR